MTSTSTTSRSLLATSEIISSSAYRSHGLWTAKTSCGQSAPTSATSFPPQDEARLAELPRPQGATGVGQDTQSQPPPVAERPIPRVHGPQVLDLPQHAPKLSRCQAGWVEFLQELDFDIECIPGQYNTLADLVSPALQYTPPCVDCLQVFRHPRDATHHQLDVQPTLELRRPPASPPKTPLSNNRDIWEIIVTKNAKAQDRNHKTDHEAITYNIGNHVSFNIRGIALPHMKSQPAKLVAGWVGPHTVFGPRLTPDTYKLELTSSNLGGLYPKFHVDAPKPWTPPNATRHRVLTDDQPSPPIMFGGEEEWVLECTVFVTADSRSCKDEDSSGAEPLQQRAPEGRGDPCATLPLRRVYMTVPFLPLSVLSDVGTPPASLPHGVASLQHHPSSLLEASKDFVHCASSAHASGFITAPFSSRYWSEKKRNASGHMEFEGIGKLNPSEGKVPLSSLSSIALLVEAQLNAGATLRLPPCGRTRC
ncbi:hypothetical protein BDK51DRAFT_51503 [Blyttiomyces helicus]|uniref:Uncharacterized protein n=1 Tax=Blyttiomyces helicus TaxID=388810 RepID=A0A4P9W3Q7_9FUNG|nr:hypothetical protein BDK51DRAFT_51503 [Blyttiomyces helicus]|eukprot:RKO85893.1 hypothetical protein BDK51DRAFT_51503 [Blyttiomyces helicus]